MAHDDDNGDEGAAEEEEEASPRVVTPPKAGLATRLLPPLVCGVIAGFGAAPLGLPFAIAAAVIVSGVAGYGAHAYATSHSNVGTVIIGLGVGMSLLCLLSGVVARGARSVAGPSATLEPVEVAGHFYLRHPELGFVVGDPGEGWEPDPLVTTTMRLSSYVLGTPLGAWAFRHRVSDATVIVMVTRLSDDLDVASAAAMAEGMVGASAGPRHAGDEPPVIDQFVRDDTREAWSSSQGFRGGARVASSARTILWTDADGSTICLSVVAASGPDEDWTRYLFDAHAPRSLWMGPGAPPAGFVPRERTLSAARERYRTQLTTERSEVMGLPPEVGVGGALTRTTYEAPLGESWAYVSPPGEAPPTAGLLWLWATPDAMDRATAEDVVRRAVAAGAMVLAPSYRGSYDNPGSVEIFAGEVDDALAALERLKALSGLPSERIVVAGAGIGATLSLLMAETGADAAAFVSVAGVDDALERGIVGVDDEGPVYEIRRVEETWIRSPIHFLAGVEAPTFFVVGSEPEHAAAARALAAEAPRHGPFVVRVIDDASDALAGSAAIELAVAHAARGESVTLDDAEIERWIAAWPDDP